MLPRTLIVSLDYLDVQLWKNLTPIATGSRNSMSERYLVCFAFLFAIGSKS
tara:strand:+ start:632 stop:784 length:153 start_codon:yes stop_codon:yes gene_type:complete